MTAVKAIKVTPDETDLRLDRWFRRRFPTIKHGQLERLLRTGQVRVDGRRVKAGYRLTEGESVRVPPVEARMSARSDKTTLIDPGDVRWVQSLVLHRDEDLIALNKPAGLAVQGGTGTHRHVDALLDGLRFEKDERPRLVHRLDKDTSGVLLLARSAAVAARMAQAFRDKSTRKTYWGLVRGVPARSEGTIETRLEKGGRQGRERMRVSGEGKVAVTRFRVRKTADNFTWLELNPITGRTHQLRVHAAEIGTPIVGDRKYGGPAAIPHYSGIPAKLHLHARSIELQGVSGQALKLVAPLPPHMRQSWKVLGFQA